MTPKVKGQTYTLLVTDIKNAYRMAKTKYVHLITFKEDDGTVYQAEEAEDSPTSKFVKNIKCTFVVSTPGTNGYMDWIRFVSIANGAVKPMIGATREDYFIAQTALHNAVLLGLQRNWTEDEILDKAFYLAGNIKQIARQLGEEMI